MASRKSKKGSGRATAAIASQRPADDPAYVEFSGLNELLGYGLRRAQGACHRDYVATIGDLAITQKQAAVMWLVQGNPGVVQGAIGAALGMDRATMMTLVNRLEQRGLLRRQRAVRDARQRELHLTDRGVRHVEQVRERIALHEQRLARLFTPGELRTLKALLGKVRRIER